MTIEGVLVAFLLADTATAGLVGNRIHPMSDPRSIARPKITYVRTNTDRSSELGAFTNDGPTGMSLATIQFDIWSDSLLTAKQIAIAVRQRLNGVSGIIEGTRIGLMRISQERELNASLTPGTEKPVQRVMIETKVTYSE